MAKKWVELDEAIPLIPGDIVRHYEEVQGHPKKKNKRRARGWSEVGVVVQICPIKGIIGLQDCLVAFVGKDMHNFTPLDFDGARPYILRYTNAGLEKL